MTGRLHFYNVASGWGKGVVEKNVQDSRRRIWIDATKVKFGSFTELNAWRGQRCRALWDEVAALWDVDAMPPVEEVLREASPRDVFDERLVANTRWYFDQIEQGGLLFYRLLSEPHLETSVEILRKRVHSDNVAWWARLLETMGMDQERALVYSSLFNGASQTMWELIAKGEADRAVIEEVFFLSSRVTLDRLLDLIGNDPPASPPGGS